MATRQCTSNGIYTMVELCISSCKDVAKDVQTLMSYHEGQLGKQGLRQTCGDELAAGDDPGEGGPKVPLADKVGEPLTGTETLPETDPGGGGELGCGEACSQCI